MAYGSAHDLPSFAELANQLKGAKMLTLVIGRQKREDFKKLEAQVADLADLIDRFYDLFGPRHWILHDPLSITKLRHILDNNTGTEDAERQLIGLYDADFLRIALLRCRKFEAMRKRNKLIEKALDDYLAGRYYASIFSLLAITDGFVNDFERVRRGFHARSDNELSAWDSPISHHSGIGRVHKEVYTKTISATRTEPVYELYRNGVMHGTVLDFDNIIVATKAWNLFFAVIDWATAKTKAEAPKPQEKTWRDALRQLTENERNKKILGEWRAYTLGPDETGFTEDEAFVACDAFLRAWQARRYGPMAACLSCMVASGHGNALPKYVREQYTPYPLEGFEIRLIDHLAAAACEIDVVLDIAGGDRNEARLRWLYEGKGEELAMLPKGNGEWKLVSWGPTTFLAL